MDTVIYLKDNENTALQIALETNNKRFGTDYHYKNENIIKATKELAKENLKYNTKNGTVYLKNEWICKPTSKNDIEKYDDIEEVVRWQFVNEIMNSARRLQRGFKAIG